MKKKLSVWLIALLSAVCVFVLAACSHEPVVSYPDENTVVITAPDTVEENTVLLDFMKDLRDDGELKFEISNGMITSVNDVANAADFSSCWMLYTSDADNANSAWGTFEYQGERYGSAVLGAESLNIKAGCLYIWAYITF